MSVRATHGNGKEEIKEEIWVEGDESSREPRYENLSAEQIKEDITIDINEQAKAATKLQALQRGRKSRRRSDKKLADARIRSFERPKVESIELAEKKAAAVKLQSIHRGFRARQRHRIKRQSRDEEVAATKLQAMVRGKNARTNTAARKKSSNKQVVDQAGTGDTKSSNHATDSSTKKKKMPGDYERPWRQKRAPKSPGGDRRKQKRSSARRKKKFARRVNAHIDGGSSIDPNLIGNSNVTGGLLDKSSKGNSEIIYWPRKAISGWGNMVTSNYGVEWPGWNTPLPKSSMSAARRRRMKEYKATMARSNLEQQWNNGTKPERSGLSTLPKFGMAKKRKERKTDHQIQQQYILKTVRRVYREAAGYYNEVAKEAKAIFPTPLPEHPPRNTRSPSKKRSNPERKPSVPPTSPLFRVAHPNAQVLTDTQGSLQTGARQAKGPEGPQDVGQQRAARHGDGGEEVVELNGAGYYFIEKDFTSPYEHVGSSDDVDKSDEAFPFDDIYEMNAVLEDPSLLLQKFAEISETIKTLWEELCVPVPERMYIANHFFSQPSITSYIQLTTHSILLNTIRSKTNSIIDTINERKSCLEQIVSAVHKMDSTELSTGGAPVLTREDLSKMTETVYALTRQIIHLINDWKKLAPWTSTFMMDGQSYTDTIQYEMELFEKMLQ